MQAEQTGSSYRDRQRSRTTLVLFLAVMCTLVARSQNGNTQLWTDGTFGTVFASMYRAELELGHRTVLAGEPQWQSLRVVPRVEVSPTAHWSFLSGAFFVDTDAEDNSSNVEWRAQLGAKYNFTPFQRIQSRLNLRYEHRWITLKGGQPTQSSTRIRIRAEGVVPLDTRNYRSDTMWYALADVEAFIIPDPEVDARFVNQVRVRAGLGRKFSYNWRAEVIYTMQHSRKSLTDEDLSYNNVIRLRVKYYLTPTGRRQEHRHLSH